ncbi:ROK family transcriptional regulator [Cohnella thermotolerans]|uniref:ROK family transcriptional regulator n=1 Tax=Cohnella thermotolerans TaxID=329858 RepID=UPI0012EBEAD3|nr:ROK family protein [Cohnella thermotolerans]
MTARILQVIRRADRPLSKKDVALASQVSLSSVSEHLDRLMNANLIVKSSIGQSSGGRKPRLYAFNPDAGYLVSIDMDTENAKVAITDFDCNIKAHSNCLIDINDGPEKVLDRIKEAVFELLAELRLDPDAVKGIGVGIPGPVEFASGMPISPTIMPGWDRYPIKEYWARYFNCPSYIDNDVNIMALGEYAKGLKFQANNVIYIKTAAGIGAGIICDGNLYRGSNGSAGDIGHFDVGGDVICWCGNRGCLEASAGGKAIVAKARESALAGKSEFLLGILEKKGELHLEDIALGMQRQDSLCAELIRESSVLIGRVIASIVNFFNPELILVGASYSEFDDTLLAAIRQGVYQRSLPLSTRNLSIQKSILGNQAGLIGAAYMTLEQLILNSINDQEDVAIL